ncbi:unnamed protein product [Vitrella brassicaformis CCMP3155]|uniref:Polygalacturonase n=1 Tax=Vitrella brassicaformis (strain CCMP3155) TaxID=1169540 RepID=A0A0G4ECK6_VITBC|nr:unnamed protein product [Vitrella brassicaformis CCMP3155]|eukprot:CEL93035.1 unnamed protein product [Vitrella brassicaformis CCMP3155]
MDALAECKTGGTLHIPDGDFFTLPIRVGSAVNMTVRIEGSLQAFHDPTRWPSYPFGSTPAFLLIEESANVRVTGSSLRPDVSSEPGSVIGNGPAWWQLVFDAWNRGADANFFRPVLVVFRRCEGVIVDNLRLQDSPMFNLVIDESRHALVEDVTIRAPDSSPNTDGIQTLRAYNVTIRRADISTGDDNVAIKSGSEKILVEDCVFGRGHGVTIGSIGGRREGTRGFVNDVTFQRIKCHRTEVGARIKTWPGSVGSVSNITYRDITLDHVDRAVVINQFYPDHPGPHVWKPDGRPPKKESVRISDVLVERLTGTFTNFFPGFLACDSEARPCVNVTLRDVSVHPSVRNPVTDELRRWQWRHVDYSDETENVEPPLKWLPVNETLQRMDVVYDDAAPSQSAETIIVQ